MSHGVVPASAQTKSRSTAFNSIEARLTDVYDKILPRQPYLLTIPSERPYRTYGPDPTRWWLTTPFNTNEGQLQYMSLLAHQDADESLLKVDGSRIDDDGQLLSDMPSPPSALPSRPETPVSTAPKKKMTLKDYKQKDRSAIQTPERPQSSGDVMRKQAIKSHKEEVDKTQAEKIALPETKDKVESKGLGIHETSTPRTATVSSRKVESKPTLVKVTREDAESQRPVKKRRTSEEDLKSVTTKAQQSKRDISEQKSLPSLLSPEMPAANKKRSPRNLPALLSPKLPASLEKAASHVPRSESTRSLLKGVEPPARALEKKKDDLSSNRQRSDSQLSAKSSVPTFKAHSPVPKSFPIASGVPTPPTQTASPRPRQRHVVRLKYGKKNRKRVEALLKLSTRIRKETPVKAEPDRPVATKQPAKVDPPVTARKHPAESKLEEPIKKPKITETSSKADRPLTPRHDIAAKSTFTTPRKDSSSGHLRPPAMQRIASTDTAEAHTPQESGRTSTPVAANHTSHPKTSPVAAHRPRSEEAAGWQDMQTRIFQLGRNLKKEGSTLAAEESDEKRKLAAVLLIEGLVCFILNAAAQAHSRPNADPGWSTILPYYNMVYKQSRPYQHLRGVVVQLGAVVRQHLLQEQIKRLSKETFDDPISAPTPGSDGNTRSGEDTIRRQKSFLELRDELVQNSKDLKIAWFEASKMLTMKTIEESYPKTWRSREADALKRNSDVSSPKDLPKKYFLPLDVSTNCFEASAYALTFLDEWAMYSRVDWKTRVEW